MKTRISARFAATLLLAASLSGCATIVGTAVSPVTGGVDLVRQKVDQDHWYFTPIFFVGGAIGGPFVALYNGLNFDVSRMVSGRSYWYEFDQVLRPYEMVFQGDY